MRRLLIALIMLCLIAAPAHADGVPADAAAQGFSLDEDAVMSGMNNRPWRKGYAPTISGDTLTICLPLVSDSAEGSIEATLIAADESVSPLRPQKLSATFRRSKGLYPVKLSLRLHSDRVNGDYPCVVRVEGEDGGGNALRSDFPLVIRIRDGKAGAPAHPQIADVSAELQIGESSEIRATLVNPDRFSAMTDLQLTVTDASGEILPMSSDKLFLQDLLPGESCEIACPVSVSPSAKVALHSLKVALTYTRLDKSATWEQTFTLPVTQQIRLENGGLQLPASVVQGDSVSLTLPLMNMGRGELKNVMATLELPGIVERQSVLVGNLPSGETKPAKLAFTPGKSALGDYSGALTVTCEDEWANPTAFTLPVTLTVEPPAALPQSGSASESAPELPERLQSPWLLYGLAGGCGLLLVLLMLQGALLRRKIHRLEEERL